MFRSLTSLSISLILLAGCGETQHPVRTETLPTTPDPVAPSSMTGTAPPLAPGETTLPPGHPPMSGMQDGMPSMHGAMGSDAPASASLNVTAPKNWKVVQPKSGMIQAEFALPKAEGDEADGRLTLMMAGGSIDANVDRWRGQFEDLEEKPVEKTKVSGVPITLVDFSGTFSEQRGMMGPVTKRPGYRMLAAILETPAGMLFVKGYGPKNTMAENADEFRTFVESLASPAKPETPTEEKPSEPAEEKAPAPAEEEAPAPAKEQTPTPAKEEMTAPAKEEALAPAKEEAPAPAEEKAPAPAEEKPAAEKEPAPAAEKAPAKEQAAAPAKKEEATASAKEEAPAPADEKAAPEDKKTE